MKMDGRDEDAHGRHRSDHRNAYLRAQVRQARGVSGDLQLEINAAHTEIGMNILRPRLSMEDPDTFFFMRGLHETQ
jgi:hypothetical protein